VAGGRDHTTVFRGRGNSRSGELQGKRARKKVFHICGLRGRGGGENLEELRLKPSRNAARGWDQAGRETVNRSKQEMGLKFGGPSLAKEPGSGIPPTTKTTHRGPHGSGESGKKWTEDSKKQIPVILQKVEV